jgi:hypothetical protein
VQEQLEGSSGAATAGAAQLREQLQPAHARRVECMAVQAAQHAEALQEHAKQQDASMQATLASGKMPRVRPTD